VVYLKASPAPLGSTRAIPEPLEASVAAMASGAAELEMSVAVGVEAPAAARRSLRKWLDAFATEELIASAELLISELVSNGVLHARLGPDSTLKVRAATMWHGGVRLEVENPGTAGTVVLAPPTFTPATASDSKSSTPSAACGASSAPTTTRACGLKSKPPRPAR
jgi:anti-sigma regulatory factor (Ser/Thr protein kinase)